MTPGQASVDEWMRANYPPGAAGTDRHSRWSPKTLREQLCVQKAPDPLTHAAINHLIDILDLHRPIGPDGKHNELHTPTCGCEDK